MDNQTPTYQLPPKQPSGQMLRPLQPAPGHGSGKKKFLKLVIFIVVLGLLAVAGWFIVRKIITSRQQAAKLTAAQQEIQRQQNFDQGVDKTYKEDKDFDGILDVDEAKYGTSVTSSDTDGDGLSDISELTQYKTDPLKSDTDGDGYSDGHEVRRGYNPAGPGTL